MKNGTGIVLLIRGSGSKKQVKKGEADHASESRVFRLQRGTKGLKNVSQLFQEDELILRKLCVF